MDKELHNKKKGIKVLSLFFIDKVDKYRHEDGTPGIYAEMFETCYKELIAKPKYEPIHNRFSSDVSQIHNGYFSQDKKGKLKDTKGNKSFVVVGLWQNQEMESDKVNLVKSVYPLDDISQRIINNAEQNKLIVINKNKAKNMLATIGIQPSEVSRILNLSNNSLSQGNEDVKYQSRNTDIDENIEDLLFDEEFYKPFENEDKTVITESLSELQSKLENMNDDNSMDNSQ